jgi:hypothetical protein
VFATDNEVAVKIMKSVMHRAKDRGWKQLSLFEEDDFEAFKSFIHDAYRNRTAPAKAVIARALERHPYVFEDAERAIRELIGDGTILPIRNGKRQLWDWDLMFDVPSEH